MVEPYIGQYCDLRRIDDICRIEFASQADLEDDNIALHLSEIQHPDSCDYLKVARYIFHGIRA